MSEDHSLTRYSLPPRYFHDGTMSPEEQFHWLREQEMGDPHWARTEGDIRRMAVDIQNKLNKKGNTEIVTAYVSYHSADHPFGMANELVRFMLTRLGAEEELLLIEEQLRRAMRAR